jgi:hypothetical protein
LSAATISILLAAPEDTYLLIDILTTNVRNEYPIPREEDYVPVIPPPEDGEPAIPALSAALVTKLREFEFERRNKQIAQLTENVPMMWDKCSPASQSKILEDPDFEDACLALDPVRLWGFIRRTHLTHIFGDGDPMVEVNIQEQLARFASLRQGEREPIASFKTRFDNQVKANSGAGVPESTESTRALEFFFKLDDKRYRRMLQYYRNKALDNDGNAYPQTLSAAYRIASGWVIEEKDQHSGFRDSPEVQSAFVTESVTETTLVTKSKIPPTTVWC